MPITHNGLRIPAFSQRWDPSDKEWVWVCWDSILRGSSIATSNWTLPAGWTSHSTLTDQTVTDEDDVAHAHSNAVLTSTTEAAGLFILANRVTLADGRVYERSVTVVVEQS